MTGWEIISLAKLGFYFPSCLRSTYAWRQEKSEKGTRLNLLTTKLHTNMCLASLIVKSLIQLK